MYFTYRNISLAPYNHGDSFIILDSTVGWIINNITSNYCQEFEKNIYYLDSKNEFFISLCG